MTRASVTTHLFSEVIETDKQKQRGLSGVVSCQHVRAEHARWARWFSESTWLTLESASAALAVVPVLICTRLGSPSEHCRAQETACELRARHDRMPECDWSVDRSTEISAKLLEKISLVQIFTSAVAHTSSMYMYSNRIVFPYLGIPFASKLLQTKRTWSWAACWSCRAALLHSQSP